MGGPLEGDAAAGRRRVRRMTCGQGVGWLLGGSRVDSGLGRGAVVGERHVAWNRATCGRGNGGTGSGWCRAAGVGGTGVVRVHLVVGTGCGRGVDGRSTWRLVQGPRGRRGRVA